MRRVVSGTGKVLITLGILILLLVAYQLWGTGIYTARAQNRLQSQFEESLREASSTATPTTLGGGATTPTSTPVTTTTIPPPPPPEGKSVGHLVIPKIGADYYVAPGVDESDLREGPGHYPLTPFPGQTGNAAIAGHRTTYGAPFGALDELENGDEITITTVQGVFTYTVYEKFDVVPTAFEVLDPDPTRVATLTLTTCTPKYSAEKRLIIKAELKLPAGTTPLPSSVNPDDPKVDRAAIAGDGLSGDTGSKTPTVIAGLILLLIGGLWWLLFHRHPRWTMWFIGVLPFAVALAIFYFYLERVLPANY